MRERGPRRPWAAFSHHGRSAGFDRAKLHAVSWRPRGAFWRHTSQHCPPIREEHAMTVTFYPARYKDTTRAQWEDAAAAWDA